MLRVLVVSDVRLLQEGLSSVLRLQHDIEIVGATDVCHARDRTADLRPDVVLYDGTRRESVEQVGHLVASAPGVKIVAFGVTETRNEILALAAAGTAGYVRSGVEARDVVNVLARVMRDELPCSSSAAASLYREIAVLSKTQTSTLPQQEGEGGRSLLSRRELQIADLLARGFSNKEIARQLSIETATVKNHVHNVFAKLKVRCRTEAAGRVRQLFLPTTPSLLIDSAPLTDADSPGATATATAAPD